jgi:hypothetical protein
VPLEDERAAIVIPPEHRNAGLEHEVPAAARVDERDSRVERQVHVAIGLLAGQPERADVSPCGPRQVELREERPGFRLAHQDRVAGVAQGPGAGERQAVDHETHLGPSGQRKAAEQTASRPEDLNSLARARSVGNHERALNRLEIEGRRFYDPACLLADLDDLPARGPCGVDAVDGVAPSIKDEVLPGACLLKRHWLVELTDDLRRDPADRSKNLDGIRATGCRRAGDEKQSA